MLDPRKLLNDLLGAQVPGAQGSVRDKAGQAAQMARDNPLAAGALAAVLLGTGTGRKLTGSALRLGGMAAVAGLAYKAYQDYKAGNAPAQQGGTPIGQQEVLPPPSDSGFHPAALPQGEEEFAVVLVRAMIAAARADGHIDDEERKRIGDRLSLAGLDPDEERFLLGELDRPVDIDAIVKAARTEEQRVEVYTASRIAIEPRTRAERGYLDHLAGRLNLPDPLVDHIEATVSASKV
jgi:uncharacterized membrane protein YebE (DUF533 family)